ncbi:arylsulfatase [Rubripirellula sp.]|nr:arylsulfatase [Rubripirellula sp.]MDB4338506.1 arylsulfatase [Rubripirellula sp.]
MTKRPNIVLIMSDDMGYSDLGCFGGEIKTPHLDQLANDGLRFTNFYSENMCWVSRAAMLTGVYHKTSMVNGSLHQHCPTLPERLHPLGYQTAISGKWHLAGKSYRVFPNDRGFDDFYGILGGAASFYAPAHLHRNRKNIENEANDDPNYYITDAISSEATRMIRATPHGNPLFLYVAYTAAHWPLHAKPEDIKAYQGQYAMGWDQLREQRLQKMKELGILGSQINLSPRHPQVPSWEKESNQLWQQRRMEVYAAQVTAMDRGIGQIIKELKDTGKLENTLILFTIDNGGCHVEYGANRQGDYLPKKTREGRPMRPGNLPSIMPGPEDTYQSYGYGWANASNTPFRMFKQFDHEGGIRTPMIAHWPAGIESPGRLVSAVSHLVDIAPTIQEVTHTGEDPNESKEQTVIPQDGKSLAAAFTGKLEHERTLFFQHARGSALRHRHWKIVREQKKPWELYHLKLDPLELNNLADQNPNQLAELTEIWEHESKRLSRQAKIK